MGFRRELVFCFSFRCHASLFFLPLLLRARYSGDGFSTELVFGSCYERLWRAEAMEMERCLNESCFVSSWFHPPLSSVGETRVLAILYGEADEPKGQIKCALHRFLVLPDIFVHRSVQFATCFVFPSTFLDCPISNSGFLISSVPSSLHSSKRAIAFCMERSFRVSVLYAEEWA